MILSELRKGDVVRTLSVDAAFERALRTKADSPIRHLLSDQLEAFASKIGLQEAEVEIYSIHRRSRVLWATMPGVIEGRMCAERRAELIFMVPFFALDVVLE